MNYFEWKDNGHQKTLLLRALKKPVIILLTLVMLTQSVGAYLLFKLKQAEVRNEMKSRIKLGVPESELVVLSFKISNDDGTAREPLWIDDHEFIYNQQLYDVVKSFVNDNQMIFHCIPDHHETLLFKNLNKLVGNEMAKDKSGNGGKIQVPVNLFMADIPGYFARFPLITQQINTGTTFTAKTWQSKPNLPPPKF